MSNNSEACALNSEAYALACQAKAFLAEPARNNAQTSAFLARLAAIYAQTLPNHCLTEVLGAVMLIIAPHEAEAILRLCAQVLRRIAQGEPTQQGEAA